MLQRLNSFECLYLATNQMTRFTLYQLPKKYVFVKVTQTYIQPGC